MQRLQRHRRSCGSRLRPAFLMWTVLPTALTPWRELVAARRSPLWLRYHRWLHIQPASGHVSCNCHRYGARLEFVDAGAGGNRLVCGTLAAANGVASGGTHAFAWRPFHLFEWLTEMVAVTGGTILVTLR